jgi:hypothetical protein
MRRQELQRLSSMIELLQFLVTRFQKSERNTVPIAGICNPGSWRISQYCRCATLDIDAQIVCACHQSSCRQNASAQLRREFRDVGRSSNQLDFAQFSEVADSLNVCLFALELRDDGQSPNSGTRHLDEVFCSGSGICLRIAISAVRHPYCDADGTNSADCLNPGRHSRFCCKFENCLESKSGVQSHEEQRDCYQGQKHQVRNFERLHSHRRFLGVERRHVRNSQGSVEAARGRDW